jgi:Histidine kinase-, DNA gyrase B-, and HSP90-like ATPase
VGGHERRRLRQILLNLVGNAVKFTGEGGVTLRARWRNGRASFEVEDTGPGISAEELSRLFEAVRAERDRPPLEGRHGPRPGRVAQSRPADERRHRRREHAGAQIDVPRGRQSAEGGRKIGATRR